jgi:methylmalonyl-CoA/ethylmalonyl-CoA epimerase
MSDDRSASQAAGSAGSEPFGLHQIGQILVPVADVDRAVAFYRDQLGMRFLFQYPGMGFFDCNGVRLLLGVPETGLSFGAVTIYYRVDDLEAAGGALEARGVRFDHPPHVVHRTATSELWMAALQDPDANPVVLMSERPVAADAPSP